ncbi:helix-turn-helix transcriptional regulator [Bacteroides thetaiotaomicron]|jgi:transcriptional regulator with XRE-family HTH domain|uniref:helix-turn-helix domain-containing protein n=1 Tax=Bacteroidales TaxID=171549 RepID=UPI0010454BC5|nr:MULTISPECIES: helix-turn-helix transcriptional regulator [Bacteroidales]MCS2244603.1 helix-turn-helix domain-containing protein [Bacteroides thetaiotaomicron]MCS2910117.1 helix-turn-helix domain-containing protein [Bacteroides thetaiotaomicron]UVP54641.1 helix-turn-helix domain-containing protein [Bacteroides thetaiotaomicron]
MDVKSIIKQKGFTMEQVAEKLEITRVTLAQNLSRNPTVNTLQKIADVIGCKVGDFFADELEEDKNTITCPVCHTKFKMEE